MEPEYITFIVVTLEVEGTHNWKNAAEMEPAVGFLQHPHRHLFKIKATKAVSHDDRDVEIILFKREMSDYLLDKYHPAEAVLADGRKHRYCDFGGRSCEMLARELAERFELASCEVMEDGENGAVVLRFVREDIVRDFGDTSTC